MTSRPEFGNYRMKSIACLTREIFRILSQYAVDHSHVPSQPALFPPCRDPRGLLSRNDKPPDIWNTQGISENVFANPPASSSSPYPGGFSPWISYVTEDTSPHVTSERQNPDTTLDPRCHASPDRQPKIQSSSVEETIQRIMGQTNNDCRFRISILTSSLHQQPLLAGR